MKPDPAIIHRGGHGDPNNKQHICLGQIDPPSFWDFLRGSKAFFGMKAQRAAFSLLELLVVVAILSILMVLTMPSLNSTLRGLQLTQGTQTILDQISLARQSAISKNRVVEIRFYRFADPSGPASQQGYRAVQSFELQDDGTAKPLDRMRRLPEGIILDSSAALSPLLGATRAKQWTTNDTRIPLPQIGVNYETRAVRLRPDGSTDLPVAGQPWFVTLHYENKGDNLGSLPDNFAMIQIDPWSGQTLLFRP